MNTDFDFEELYRLLYEATKKAFISIQQNHVNEHFYAFALYTSGELSYLIPTSCTEEGLSQVTEVYMRKYKDKYFKEFSLQKMRNSLRWSPADSPIHAEGEIFFSKVNEYIGNVPEILSSFPKDSWEEFDEFVSNFMRVCIRVLKQVDTEDVFGKEKKRNEIVLNILMGDQSDEERLKYAKLLNPPVVYERYESGLTERLEVRKNKDHTI